jgi:ABC-type glycerol-3-phosphate transport system substrate-binding protein
MMEATSEETMKSGMALANWIRSGFQPNRHAMGVAESLNAGAAMWPDEPYFSLAHTAIGKHAADFLSGKKTAKETLADAAKEYEQAAKEKGFIK